MQTDSTFHQQRQKALQHHMTADFVIYLQIISASLWFLSLFGNIEVGSAHHWVLLDQCSAVIRHFLEGWMDFPHRKIDMWMIIIAHGVGQQASTYKSLLRHQRYFHWMNNVICVIQLNLAYNSPCILFRTLPTELGYYTLDQPVGQRPLGPQIHTHTKHCHFDLSVITNFLNPLILILLSFLKC